MFVEGKIQLSGNVYLFALSGRERESLQKLLLFHSVLSELCTSSKISKTALSLYMSNRNKYSKEKCLYYNSTRILLEYVIIVKLEYLTLNTVYKTDIGILSFMELYDKIIPYLRSNF